MAMFSSREPFNDRPKHNPANPLLNRLRISYTKDRIGDVEDTLNALLCWELRSYVDHTQHAR